MKVRKMFDARRLDWVVSIIFFVRVSLTAFGPKFSPQVCEE